MSNAAESSESEEFGRLLRHYRLRAGLTQEALAERSGLSPRTISGLEQGETSPHRHTAERLGAVLVSSSDARARFLATAAPSPRRRPAVAPRAWPGPDLDAGRQPLADRSGGPASVASGDLPFALTGIVGREEEIAAIGRLLADQARFVTLTGPGGVGKTRLALAAAEGARERFRDGVVVVSLAALGDPQQVVLAIAQALGLNERAGQPLIAQVAFVLRDKEMLLVLDNFEHVLEAAPEVTTLLTRCRHLRVLATSREALRVQGEQQFPVPTLGLPDAGGSLPHDRLDGYAAIALFVQRARTVRPDFALDRANAADVARICALLDGLPLAIELAAARTDFLPPRALRERLAHPLDVLTDGARDGPARQRTWRATVAWSHDLLTPGERALFRRFAVFAGGCSLEAATAICGDRPDAGDAPIPIPDVHATLRSLVAKNLLRLDGETPDRGADDAVRLAMLGTIREFGLERLATSGEIAAVRRRHADHYLAFAEEARPHLVGPGQLAWLDRVDRDLDNLRAAFRWCLDLGRAGDDAAIELGLGAAGALSHYWTSRGGIRQGRDLLLGLLRLPGARPGTTSRARALRVAGLLSAVCGDVVSFHRLSEEGIAMSRAMGDELGVARAVLNVGTLLSVMPALDIPDPAAYRAALEEALALFERLDSEREVGLAVVSLAHLSLREGDLAGAEARIARAMPICESSGDSTLTARALSGLAEIALARGDARTARRHFGRALELYRLRRSHHGAGNLLGYLGDIARDAGERDAATAYYHQALAALSDTGDVVRSARPVLGLAVLAADAGEVADALALAAAATSWCRTAGAPSAVDAQQVAELRAVAARSLSAEEVAAAWDEGRVLTLEQVIDRVLATGAT